MKLIDQHTKRIMEECKERAIAAGLSVYGETLEFIVSNRDLLELSSKSMIPTLYDYWIDDVEVVGNKWIYDVFPNNPYETVINTRPAISFYNNNNPDWLNVMIFYHVLAHIDCLQNNVFFRNTWDDDFCGQALADKGLIEKIREERGAEKRWVDYVIEFARSIGNLVGFYPELEEVDRTQIQGNLGIFSEKVKFYFGVFLKERHQEKTITLKFYDEEIERLDRQGEEDFFNDPDFVGKFPEFGGVFKKYKEKRKGKTSPKDILQYLMENSEFLDKEENEWMKIILQVIRNTSLYFQPQIRTKVLNEGWASYWHERLFITDDRITGHEVNFAKVNSGVMLDPRIGFNPYSVGKHLFEFVEDMARHGKLSPRYRLLGDSETRKNYDEKLGEEVGKQAVFEARKNFNDFMFINFLTDEDFQDFVDRYKLFIAGARPSPRNPGRAEIYIKSKSGRKYRQMINKSLYHPPHCVVDEEKAEEQGSTLYIDHIFEDRTLVTKYIPAVLMGLSYFCGNELVNLETTEFKLDNDEDNDDCFDLVAHPKYKKYRVLYSCEDGEVQKVLLYEEGEE